jgi:hypothetical protein
MANQYGINLGEVYRTAEAVKGARTQNRLNDLKLQETERQIKERPMRQNMLSQARAGAVSGDESAQQQLLVLDPEGGPKFLEAVSKMGTRRMEQTKKIVDETGRLSAYVLQGETPEEQARRYQVMYNGVSPEVQKNLPPEYNKNFVEVSMAKATAMDKILENPKSVRFGGQDILYKGGKEIERANVPQKKGSTGGMGGIGGLKSADESLMYRQAASYFGGFTDPKTGEIRNLLSNDVPKVQALTAEAAKLFSEGNVPRSEAVQLAAEKLGIKRQQLSEPQQPNQMNTGGIKDGTTAKNAKGEIIVFKNGQWVSRFGEPVR